MSELEIRPLRDGERAGAAALVARAMRDNPIELAVAGQDPERRRRALVRMFDALLAVAPARPLVAVRAGAMVGLAGGSPPGTCPLPLRSLLRVLLALAASGPRTFARRWRWLAAWGAHDPAKPHWHVGPVAVEPELQGRGIGTCLLERLCARVDAEDAVAYLETDRAENVRFYRRFGFETVGETEVIGVRSWFMQRQAR